jgi:integrase
VVLVPPREGRGWTARFTDPDHGTKSPDLRVHAGVTDERGARSWAKTKSHELASRRDALTSGAPRTRGEPIGQALDRFLKMKANKKKPDASDDDHFGRRMVKWERATREAPQQFKRFLAWADGRGLTNTADITCRDLAELHTDALGMTRTDPLPGGMKGARAESGDLLAIRSRYGLIVRVRGFLKWCARNMLLSQHVNTDQITGTLTIETVQRKKPKIVSRVDLRRIIEAALRHDKDHGPIAGPLALMFVLTGMRSEEVTGLDWAELSGLEDADDPGKIELPGYRVKTGRGRTISLDVTPALKGLLAAMFLRAGRPKTGLVFPSSPSVRVVRERLVGTWDEAKVAYIDDLYGAPPFVWKDLRSTSGSFLACAPGCGYTLRAVADRLGHDTDTAEKYYQDRVPVGKPRERSTPAAKIPFDADTLERALGVEDLGAKVVAMFGGKGHDAERRSQRQKRSSASR